MESSKKSYTDVSIRIWIGDSFVSPVSTPSKISIQNPILMVELGNQRRSNPPEEPRQKYGDEMDLIWQ